MSARSRTRREESVTHIFAASCYSEPERLVAVSFHGVCEAARRSPLRHPLRISLRNCDRASSSTQGTRLWRLAMKMIFVPLDGSILAEQVLPYVSTLARLLEAKICLLRV